MIRDWLAFRRDILGFMVEQRRKGPLQRFQLGPVKAWLVSEPALAGQVLVSRAADFGREDALRTVARYLMGQGMLTSEGPEHARQRALGRSAMAAGRVPEYRVQLESLALQMAQGLRDVQSQDLDVAALMGEFSLRAAAQCLFGSDPGPAVRPWASALERAVDALQPVPSFPPQGWWLLVSPAFRRDKRLILEAVDSLLESRRGRTGGSLFADHILAAEAQGQTRARSREIALAVLLAGSETTAMALTWTFYLLAKHGSVQERLRAASSADAGLAERVLYESMRLYPPVWMLGRQALRRVELDGLCVEQGERVYISQYLLHRDERCFEQPERFDPDRWTEGFIAGLPPYAYLPFGAGPRGCFGEGFAMAELKSALAAFTQGLSWELLDAGEPSFKPFITLRPKGGLRLRVRSLGIAPEHGGKHG